MEIPVRTIHGSIVGVTADLRKIQTPIETATKLLPA